MSLCIHIQSIRVHTAPKSSRAHATSSVPSSIPLSSSPPPPLFGSGSSTTILERGCCGPALALSVDIAPLCHPAFGIMYYLCMHAGGGCRCLGRKGHTLCTLAVGVCVHSTAASRVLCFCNSVENIKFNPHLDKRTGR